MAHQNELEDRFVKIYLLTHLTEEEQSAYLATFQNEVGDDPGLTWVKPQFIDWPRGQAEGSIEGGEMLRLFKQNISADPEGTNFQFQYFADRQSVDSSTVIVAHRDAYTMLHSDQTAREITDLAAESGITLPENWAEMDAVVENLMDDLTGRGVAWGRIPISQWRSSWCNFDISNMGEDEFIEYCGDGSSRILRDPEWDSGSFVEKLREEVQEKGNIGLSLHFVSVAEDAT